MAICVLGSLNLDTVLQVERLPRPGETLGAVAVSEHLGGKGANQAVASARMGQPTAFVGAVGADEAANAMGKRLGDAGVDLSYLTRMDGEPTGRAYICVAQSGENSIVIVGGANTALEPRHLPTAAVGDFTVFLAQLETPLPVVAALFSDPRAQTAIRILNTAPAVPEARALFPLVDILILNETELMTYAGLESEAELAQGVGAAARGLISRPAQVIIVTMGAAGVVIVRAKGETFVPGHKVDVVDTTGAGDCFCGVLAAGLDQGLGIDEAVAYANAASALSVTRLGAAASAPSRDEVERFLNP